MRQNYRVKPYAAKMPLADTSPGAMPTLGETMGGDVMGWRFRKSIRLAPGLRVNVSKKSVSVTVGPRGLKTTVGTAGRTTTVGIPGTGVSHVSRKGWNNQDQARRLMSMPTDDHGLEEASSSSSMIMVYLGWALVLFMATCVLIALVAR